jgi:isocitrate dehydrogenase
MSDHTEAHHPSTPVPITVAHGDGIGPEIMDATLEILEAAGAAIAPERISVGEQVYAQGHSSGITPEAWESIRRTRVLLKAPITTPTGGGVKSLNVTLRKTLGLFANVRPVHSLHPFVRTKHPIMDVVIVRENEEDLYAGIEHRQTDEVTQCLKLISRPGSERLIRYAFAYARAMGRRGVACLVKDNIMKLTDGLFHEVFEQVAEGYPDIEARRYIIDIGTALLADRPEDFDVIVTPNLYGDILSDVAAQIAGSVGLAGSANLGAQAAMFEAVHGSAPDIAGKGVANPSGLLKGAILMLVHIGQPEVASRIRNAWLRTIEEGIHTADIFADGTSTRLVGTRDFARAVIAHLGETPLHLPTAHYSQVEVEAEAEVEAQRAEKQLVGVDVFCDWTAPGRPPEQLAARLREAAREGLDLVMITNRGVKVWPNGFPETFCTDHWRCRFQRNGAPIGPHEVTALLTRLVEHKVDVIKTENLYTFDGVPGFSLGQGQ